MMIIPTILNISTMTIVVTFDATFIGGWPLCHSHDRVCVVYWWCPFHLHHHLAHLPLLTAPATFTCPHLYYHPLPPPPPLHPARTPACLRRRNTAPSGTVPSRLPHYTPSAQDAALTVSQLLAAYLRRHRACRSIALPHLCHPRARRATRAFPPAHTPSPPPRLHVSPAALPHHSAQLSASPLHFSTACPILSPRSSITTLTPLPHACATTPGAAYAFAFATCCNNIGGTVLVLFYRLLCTFVLS